MHYLHTRKDVEMTHTHTIINYLFLVKESRGNGRNKNARLECVLASLFLQFAGIHGIMCLHIDVVWILQELESTT